MSASVVVAFGKETTVRGWRSAAPIIKKLGGWTLVVVGVWFLLLTIFAGVFPEVFPV